MFLDNSKGTAIPIPRGENLKFNIKVKKYLFAALIIAAIVYLLATCWGFEDPEAYLKY